MVHRSPFRGVFDAVRVAFVLLCGLLLPATANAGDAMLSVGTWFKIGVESASDWNIKVDEKDPELIHIQPKRLNSSQHLRHVLVLYPRASSAYDTAMTKIVNVFSDKRIDTVWTVHNFAGDGAKGRAAIAQAEAKNYDLILSMGSESTAWLWYAYRGGRLPVVSVCSKDPVLLGQMKDYKNGSGSNFAFTSLNMPIEAQMSYVMQLRPNLKNLAILVDESNVSAMQTQASPAEKFAKTRGIQVFNLALKPSADAKIELGRLVSNAVAAMQKNDPDLSNSVFWITGSTAVFAEIETINANSYRVPVLSTVIDVVQPGANTAALSVGISFESNGYQAALFAADILEGRRKVADIPVGIVSPPDIAISFRKAREIGMRLPFALFEGATLIYDNDGNLVRSPQSVRVVSQHRANAAKPDREPLATPGNAFSIE